MQKFGPLHHVQTGATVIDPRFGTEATPVQPAEWVGQHDNGTMDGGFVTRSSTHYRTQILPALYPEVHTGVYDWYDGIEAGNFKTSRVLGQDDYGNDIMAYRFTQPNVPNSFDLRKLKVGIMTGVHGNERTPVTGLYYFLKDFIENKAHNEMFHKLLSLLDIHVIPIGTPTGWDDNTRVNRNDVNINRNFTTLWDESFPNPGTGPASEPETQIIETWMEEENFDVYIDIHNTVGIDNPWFAANQEKPEGMALIRDYYQVESINHRWWSDRPDINYTAESPLGRTNNYPYTTPMGMVHADALGVPHTMLIETAQRYSPDTYGAGPASNTFSAETIGNILLTSLNRILNTHQA